jgi:hypothetical protein
MKSMFAYLDIDGVAIPTTQRESAISIVFAARIRRILDATGAKIVVSSSRRRSAAGVLDLLRAADIDASDLADDWMTKLDLDVDPDLPIRGQEIDEHHRRAGCPPYVILDDFPMLPHQRPHHVQPDAAVGLTDIDVVRAIAILTLR